MPKLSLSVLSSRKFRLFCLMRMCMTAAVQGQAVIVGWQVYSLTHSVFLLGMLGLAEALPALAGAMVAGHMVDKVGRPGLTYGLSIVAHALNMLVFLLFAGGFMEPPGGDLLPWLFGGVFVSGLARSFYTPSGFSILPRIVARHEMGSALAWSSSVWQCAAVSGPAAAGLIYGSAGARGAWLFSALLTAIVVPMAIALRVPHTPRVDEKRESTLKSIRAGWRFIFENPVLLSTMSIDMFAVLFGGATALLPAYADAILHVGAEGLGALRAAPMAGAMLVSLFFAVFPMRRLSAKRLLIAVSGFGLCIIGFGLSTSFPLSMLFLALGGGFDSISVVMRNTMTQIITPDHMRGRVTSISSMFVISSNEIGAFESGMAARLLGLMPSVVAGGIATLIVAASVALVSPKFRKTVVEA